MTRIVTMILLASFAASALAQEPPKAMPPANEVAPPRTRNLAEQPQAKPQNEMPPKTAETASEMCSAEGDCCPTRVGRFRRLAAQWCGTTSHAFVDPTAVPACNEPCVWTPTFVCYQQGQVCLGERCGHMVADRCWRWACGVGLGRFFGERCPRERVAREWSALDRLKSWLAGRPHGHQCASNAMPTPYHTPVRYYFTDGVEPNCGGNSCASGGCGADGFAGGGGREPRVMSGSGGSFLARLRGGAESDGRSGGRGGLCRHKEQCYDVVGSHFHGNIRFARDERPAVPPINAGKPYQNYGNGFMHQYSQTPQPDSKVIPAGGVR